MNESQLPGLVEDFQDDALSEANCRELMDWFDEDESRVLPFVDELRVGNALAALQVMDSDRIPLAVKDSLQQGDLAIDISRDRASGASKVALGHCLLISSNQIFRAAVGWPWFIATSAVAAGNCVVVRSAEATRFKSRGSRRDGSKCSQGARGFSGVINCGRDSF